MGRLFMNYQPTEIQDKATLMAIENHPDFEKVTDEEKVQAPAETKVLADECPKCGKVVKRGKYMHQKHCKGKK